MACREGMMRYLIIIVNDLLYACLLFSTLHGDLRSTLCQFGVLCVMFWLQRSDKLQTKYSKTEREYTALPICRELSDNTAGNIKTLSPLKSVFYSFKALEQSISGETTAFIKTTDTNSYISSSVVAEQGKIGSSTHESTALSTGKIHSPIYCNRFCIAAPLLSEKFRRVKNF